MSRHLAPEAHLLPTPFGPLGIAWMNQAIIALQLPEPTPEETLARLALRCQKVRGAAPLGGATEPPPAWLAPLLHLFTEHLSGRPRRFDEVPLDLADVPPFHRRVYEAARRIPPGTTSTYGELAAQVGQPDAARAVGQAMATNRFPLVVPCHRVLAAGRKIGGFSAHRGVELKRDLLALECIGCADGSQGASAAPAVRAPAASGHNLEFIGCADGSQGASAAPAVRAPAASGHNLELFVDARSLHRAGKG